MKLKSEEEIQEFWASHDSADYFDDMEDDEVEVVFKGRKDMLVLPLDLGCLRTIRELALKRGISSNDLFKSWIKERIETEKANLVK